MLCVETAVQERTSVGVMADPLLRPYGRKSSVLWRLGKLEDIGRVLTTKPLRSLSKIWEVPKCDHDLWFCGKNDSEPQE